MACCTELTQTAAMENTEATRRAFERLACLGVEVSIDDFAAGDAGLAALSHQPVRELQIDRPRYAGAQPTMRERWSKACGRRAELGLRVVAGASRTEAQRDAAVRLGCHQPVATWWRGR